MTSWTPQVTHRNILRVLLAGFALVIVLLLAGGFVSIRNIRSIQANATTLVEEQEQTASLVKEIQREQGALNAVFYNLARHPEPIDRDTILSRLAEAEKNIDEIVVEAAGAPDEKLWAELKQSSAAFAEEARRLLAQENPSSLLSRDLFQRHQQVTSIVARLMESNARAAQDAEQAIDRQSRRLATQSFALFGACLLLAMVFALVTVRLATGLFRSMEWQASELSRVSWHMLENQETAARRFSHELHDELGQTLTALKANLLPLSSSPEPNKRVADCLRLVDEAILNVREMSQLLHPTILDDLGLDAGIRWLSDKFRERTSMDIDYVSHLDGRLPEETERHLFRIAQEALTNVARHSGARRVRITLDRSAEVVRLTIADDGKGLEPKMGQEPAGFGMIGMRARARSAGGELSLRSRPGQGLEIEVRVPAGDRLHAKETARPAG